MNDHVSCGKEAEKRGVNYLKKQGYRIIGRNFTSKAGEIDIIAEEGSDLVFIEVKYRASADFGSPEEFVDKKKQSKIIKTALFYIKEKRVVDKNIRFDVLALNLFPEETRLIKSAFESPSAYKY